MGDLIQFPVDRTKARHDRNVELAARAGKVDLTGPTSVQILVGSGVMGQVTFNGNPVDVIYCDGRGIANRLRP